MRVRKPCKSKIRKPPYSTRISSSSCKWIKALIHLQEEELIRVEYGGLRILDLQGLRTRMIDRRNRDNQLTEKIL